MSKQLSSYLYLQYPTSTDLQLRIREKTQKSFWIITRKIDDYKNNWRKKEDKILALLNNVRKYVLNLVPKQVTCIKEEMRDKKYRKGKKRKEEWRKNINLKGKFCEN